jgi:hypothetical protein
MIERFDAWWLPDDPAELTFESIAVGDVECRYPIPTPALVESTIRSLRRAARALVERPVNEIVEAIDKAAARLLDREDPIRIEAEGVLAATTGYSPAMTTLILDRMAADWRADPIRRLLHAELGDPAVLDRFAAVDPRRRVRAYGPRLAFHVFAGNVPGVAVTSLIRSMLAKTPSLGKLASGQPVLPVLFARALDSVDPALARALAITYWPGGSSDAEWRVLEAADLVVVYGGPDAVSSFRSRVPPHHRLLLHGPRFSVGLIARDQAASDPTLPDRVARAVATFDQHGCVSPQSIWVEDTGGALVEEFGEKLADSFRRLEDELPRGRISPQEAASIQMERGAAELRGHSRYVRIFAPTGTEWTVVLDHEPAFRPSCLNRFIHLHPIGSLEEGPDILAPGGHHLQSVAVAATPERTTALAHDLARIGATRITSFDRIPFPPPEWHHDGRGPLRELLRWVDLEQ